MKYVLEKMAVFFIIIVILPSSASAQGHSLHPFWWIADWGQCCVKTDKQHLQQWQLGTPSVPRSPAKSAYVPSHLLRPSSPLPLPRCFYCCCLQGDPSFIWTSPAGPALQIHLKRTQLTAVRNTTLVLRSTPPPLPLLPVHMHNFCSEWVNFFFTL